MKKYKLTGMHCPSCAMNIEGELEDGGINARVNFAKSELTVDSGENNEKKLTEIVKKLGYGLTPA